MEQDMQSEPEKNTQPTSSNLPDWPTAPFDGQSMTGENSGIIPTARTT